MQIIRAILGSIILFFDRLIPPKPLARDPARQSEVDAATKRLTIYQFEGCPFCVKVRRQAKRLGLKIEYRDAQRDPQAKRELLEGGQEVQVPCLRIESDSGVKWMYESGDINAYLADRFASS